MANELFNAQQPGPQGPPQAGPPQAGPPQAGPPQAGPPQAQGPPPPRPPAGLIGVQPPATPQAPSGIAPLPPEIGFGEEEASPEEQAQYSQLVNKALDFMGQNPEATLASMSNQGIPVHEQIGELAVSIVKNIMGQAQAAQVELGQEVLQNAGVEIIEHLYELADVGNILPFELVEDSEEAQTSMSMALIHAEKVAGDQLLQSPEYTQEMKDEAGDFYAQQVAGEVQRGEVAPDFHENLAAQSVTTKKRVIQGR